MRIGELAALAGVSTRTVRHYHHVGLLPEPERGSNGYRSYQLRDLMLLVRSRHLAELGLSLDEISDVLAGDSQAELIEILTELDGDLAARQQHLQRQRDRIALVLAAGGDTRPAELAALIDELTRAFGPDHPGLDRERVVAELLHARLGDRSSQLYRQILDDDELRERLTAASHRFEALADVAPNDPAVEAVAAAAGRLGPAVVALLPPEIRDQTGDLAQAQRFLDAVSTDMSPAQARCLRLMVVNWLAASKS